MKIKTSILPSYKEGTTKSVIRFAFLPHRIGDKIVWLERYEVLYIWAVERVKGEEGGNQMEFTIVNWKKVSEAVI